MVFGVFDLLHPGHVNFLRQAKKLGDYLVVSVARDINVKKIKGLAALKSEKQRAAALKKLNFVDKVVLGRLGSPWPHIKKENPDVIALGYDQKNYIRNQGTGFRGQEQRLELELRKHGLKTKVVRLKSFKPELYKSSRLRELSA